MTLVALFAMTAGALAGTRATGSFDNCTGHNGSIHVHGWAYDPDASATSIFVHAYIWYGMSVGSTKEERLPAVGILADIERADVNTAKGITGNHGFNKYVAVPAGTYTVQIFAIDQNGDGNPPIPGPTSGSNYQTYTVTVSAPFTVSFDANGGSDAPANQNKCTGIDLTLSSDQPVREGYTFVGWNTAQDGSGDSYAPGATYTANADVTLYAQWSNNYIEVTTNAAEGETTFTEAWFDMPAFDATVEYEALRDMSVQMTAQVGDGEDGYRLRIKKNAQNVFEPADMEFEDMLALFTVTDEIEQKSLTFFGQTVDCNLSVYAVDENDQPTGDAITDFTTLVPGRYVVMATAATGSEYDGQTAPSNIFELYQGYEVTVPAGEFVTYYKDEALTLYDDEAQLYTITAVSETTATATPFDVIPANVPLLLKNNSSQTRTILLIPTEDPLAFMHYSGFVGSLDPTTIAASTDTQTNYACNGKAFVYVKDAISAGANKAWLEIPASANGARQLKIVFADATGIGAVSGSPADNGDWFDLNGRKIAKPTKKGVYIKDGKKVVVK